MRFMAVCVDFQYIFFFFIFLTTYVSKFALIYFPFLPKNVIPIMQDINALKYDIM